MNAALLSPVTSFLDDQLGDELVAAFIYGSVAAGRNHSDSDIDCFVLVDREVPQETRQQVGCRFADLQRQLDFTPEPDYPIEIFSMARCETLLADPLLDIAIGSAAITGMMDPLLAESDAVEVLRALLDRRLVIRPARELDQLTARAYVVLDRRPADVVRLKRALRLTGETQ